MPVTVVSVFSGKQGGPLNADEADVHRVMEGRELQRLLGGRDGCCEPPTRIGSSCTDPIKTNRIKAPLLDRASFSHGPRPPIWLTGVYLPW